MENHEAGSLTLPFMNLFNTPALIGVLFFFNSSLNNLRAHTMIIYKFIMLEDQAGLYFMLYITEALLGAFLQRFFFSFCHFKTQKKTASNFYWGNTKPTIPAWPAMLILILFNRNQHAKNKLPIGYPIGYIYNQSGKPNMWCRQSSRLFEF